MNNAESGLVGRLLGLLPIKGYEMKRDLANPNMWSRRWFYLVVGGSRHVDVGEPTKQEP